MRTLREVIRGEERVDDYEVADFLRGAGVGSRRGTGGLRSGGSVKIFWRLTSG